MNFLKKHWPIIALALIVLIVGILNHKPGTILSGGDNLHPEFNFWLNIKRSIFSVWQEYQGLGLLAGMGHAADLPRQLILLLISTVIPLQNLRYIWTIITLFIGSTGAFYLIRKVVRSKYYVASIENEKKLHTTYYPLHTTFTAFLGALFYIFNLATLQSYYTPFEVFTSHFAALPWLLYLTIRYFQKPDRKNFIWMLLGLILSTPQAYVPTVFVVWLAATGILTLFLSFNTENSEYSENQKVRKSDKSENLMLRLRLSFLSILKNFRPMPFAKFWLFVFLVNAFWLLPFAYFTLTSAHVDISAKINQMSSENIFLLNKEFGNIQDVVLLKGFWFNNIEPNLAGNSVYMLKIWKDHIQNPFITGIGYLLFAVILTGLISTIRRVSKVSSVSKVSRGNTNNTSLETLDTRGTRGTRGTPILLAFVAIFLFVFTMLTTATPPFSWIISLMRTYVPLFGEVFRFPFTKFSLLAGLMYAIFFTLGTQVILSFLSTRMNKKVFAIGYLLLATLLIIWMFPVFTGNLFYNREQFSYPKEYQELTKYLQTQDPTARIANFPQSTFWEWKFYNFGYSGSGFLWYGIEQPILDRTFDMFSSQNENYYFEITNGVYTKNPSLINEVLQKYQVSFLLLDKNLTYPPSPQALFYTELEDMLKKTPRVTKVKTFGNLLVYKVSLTDKPNSYVFIQSKIPTVNSYTWSNDDTAYSNLGTYTTLPNTKYKIQNTDYFYPLRSLFSLKAQSNNTFSLVEEGETLAFKTTLPPLNKQTYLHVPSYLASESTIPVTVYIRKISDTESAVRLKFKTPQIFFNNHNIWGATIEYPLTTLYYAVPTSGQTPPAYSLNVNGILTIPLTNNEEDTTTFLSLVQDNRLTITNKTNATAKTIVLDDVLVRSLVDVSEKDILLHPTDSESVLRITVPKLQDNYASYKITADQNTLTRNCNTFREGTTIARTVSNDGVPLLNLSAQNATACSAFASPTLSHKEGYAVFLDHRNVSGQSFHFWLLNEDEKYAPIDTYLQKSDLLTSAVFILPPQDDFGKGYSFHLDSISIGKDISANQLEYLAAYPIPYTFLTSLVIGQLPNSNDQRPKTKDQTIVVSHPNESLYILRQTKTKDQRPKTIILSQSYDSGWAAYEMANGKWKMANSINAVFPFIFGKKLTEHVMVNNWENGWNLNGQTMKQFSNETIIIVYLPQYLEYIGFSLLLLALTFPFLLKKSSLDTFDTLRKT